MGRVATRVDPHQPRHLFEPLADSKGCRIQGIRMFVELTPGSTFLAYRMTSSGTKPAQKRTRKILYHREYLPRLSV